MSLDMAPMLAAVAAARQALEDGDAVDLAGLDLAINSLCEEAHALSGDARLAAAEQMIRLGEALDGLAAGLKRRGEAEQRQRAAGAYGGEDGA